MGLEPSSNRKSLDVQATVFLLLVAGLLSLAGAAENYGPGQALGDLLDFASSIVQGIFGVVYLLLSYFGWKRVDNRLVFLAIALVSGFMSFVFVIFEILASLMPISSVTSFASLVFVGSGSGGVLIMFLILFFSFRVYRSMLTQQTVKS